MKTIEDWLDFIFSQKHKGYGNPLTRMTPYFEAFQLDSTIAPVIIGVTGTNGKGSTARLLEAIYLAAGYRVATMTSPHILNFCERLTLNGQQVEQALVLDAFLQVMQLRGDAKMNPFDFICCALLLCVKKFKPQIAILEVGVGGRLDLTNLFDLKAAVITTIGLDHVDLLGNMREQVAFEKAHLARKGRPLICGEPDAPQTLFEVAQEIGATVYQKNSRNNGFSYELKANSWDWLGPLTAYRDLPIPTIKLQNAATALMGVESLQDELPVEEASICHALKHVVVPGRFEIIQRQCPIILDVAHNAQACHWLALQLKQHKVKGKTLMVFGMIVQKPLHESLQAFSGIASCWYVGAFKARESHPAAEIKQELEALGEKNCYTNNDFRQSLHVALKEAGPDDRIVVFGSFLAVAQAKRSLLGDLRFGRLDDGNTD